MATLRLPAEIAHASAAGVVQTLRAEMAATEATSPAVLDAWALQKFDSSALAVLLALWRVSQAQGRAWQVQGANERLQNLATLYGVEDLLLA